MTRQLTVKLKFEVEEEGGVTTALLRIPGEAPLTGRGTSVRDALDALFLSMACSKEGPFSLIEAVICATDEAQLAALWTP